MPWCPSCKNEYREGITVCADCGVDLVDELPEDDDSESIGPRPKVLLLANEKSIAEKVVKYLRLNGIYSAAIGEGVIDAESETTETDVEEAEVTEAAVESDGKAYAVIVADIEEESVYDVLSGVVQGEVVDEDRLYELVPDIEDTLDEVENEEASMQFSEMQSEASSVYVHKKDKYADLKFSGYSFIGFGLVGFAIVALNALKIINFFNLYSMIIMSLVFTVFMVIGIASLVKASKIKKSVEVEDEFTEQLNEWIETNLTDDLIDEWYDENREDQENYFEITEKLQKMLSSEFPNINPSYIDELTDERYNSYLERSAYESSDDIPMEEEITEAESADEVDSDELDENEEVADE